MTSFYIFISFPSNGFFEYHLQWILHDWNDEECVSILKRCKEAIISREDGGGKVIIIDVVMGSNKCYEKSNTSQIYMDMLMMVMCNGAERGEQEWEKIFIDSGFKDYKITPTLGLRSVIEVYP
ncbi:uncharacterized protein A4U43_C05F28680 [Asparagus officinalis]|uniref:O-methyltransferase C-terminal domain-containing protein n=1 Tax=Asparagus officinalis TaxID=4686 RepID=A0A5P1EWR5_ASPOF|nr:uncharacterized protein A4U43_C05F28680 [Asparagus officinalis]